MMTFRLEQQVDGLWKAILLDGGYIEYVADCPSERDAENAALYALAKNREYKEDGAE